MAWNHNLQVDVSTGRVFYHLRLEGKDAVASLKLCLYFYTDINVTKNNNYNTGGQKPWLIEIIFKEQLSFPRQRCQVKAKKKEQAAIKTQLTTTSSLFISFSQVFT